MNGPGIGGVGLAVMAISYAAGACLSVFARSARAARVATASGAVVGGAAGLAAALSVLVTRHELAVDVNLVAAAGGLALRLDPLGAVFLALTAVVSLPVAIYGVTYFTADEGRRSLAAFGMMFNGFLLGMSLVPCAGNVFTFLLAWELMGVTSYFLVMTDNSRSDVRQAGLWYAAMTQFGFVLLLPMFLLLAPDPGATSFADLRSGAAALSPALRDGVFLLAVGAFGAKSGIVPLHVWLPRAHPAAPSHVSALMSGVMIKLGIYGLLRVSLDFLGAGPPWWGGLVLVAGSLSALTGVLYALADNDLKRLLAYSSIENVGVMWLGIGAGLVLESYHLHALAVVGFGAALLHAVNHGSFKALLFLASGPVLHEARTRNMDEMGGLIKGMPQTALLFLIGAAAAAALPPLNGFASEWLIFQALLSGVQIPKPEVAIGAPLAIGVLALTSGLAAACFVKAFGITFLAMPRSDAAGRARESHISMRVAMACLAGACVALGLAAPSAFAEMSWIADSVLPGAVSRGRVAGGVWLLSANGVARMSPLLIAAWLGAVVLLAFLAVRIRGFSMRRTDTWGCGRIRQTPRMEYTSSAFAEPLRRIFSEFYRPTEDLSISAHPESPYFVRSITYTSQIVPRLEQALYDPVVRAARGLAASVRRLQAGSAHLYLLYITGALIGALASAWWFK